MTKPLLSPKLDLVFKQLFVQDSSLLLDILNQVLSSYEYHTMTTLTIRNPQILPELIHEKFIILDVHVEDEFGRGYDVEMQSQSFNCYPQHSLYYLTKYSQQLDNGAKYHQPKAVFGVHFLGYRLFPEQKSGKHCFEWQERHHPDLRLTNQIQMALFIFELPKLNLETSTPLNQWLHFFNYDHSGEKPMHYTHPPVQKAYALLQQISADESVRQLAEMRERALMNEVTMLADAEEKGIEEGMKKGIEEGKITIARALLDVLDDETIALKTELPIETLKKLRSNSDLMVNV
jgi:predicted transposase/invertase (TIGR01784 family)